MESRKRYSLTKAAELLGMSRWALRDWVYKKRAPSIKNQTGRLFLPAEWVDAQMGGGSTVGGRCALYARESSSENKSALASQLQGLTQFAMAKGYIIVHSVSEIGSGLNDDRKKLHSLLTRRDFDVLVVEHKDRLTRFGFRWFETLCPFKIEVINLNGNATHDLMEDLVAILTSFAARLYGQRRGRKKTQAAIQALETVE